MRRDPHVHRRGDPDGLARAAHRGLRDHQHLSRLPAAIEELLRFEPPIEQAFRTTAREIELSGCPVPASVKIRAVVSSANRDPGTFSDPDELRLDRPTSESRKHLAFGTGKHACLGAALARMELRIAFETLLTRLPGFELHPDHPVQRVPNLHTNGFAAVRIRWDVDRARAAAAAAGATGPGGARPAGASGAA